MKNKKNYFICIIGLDGSGKSTLAIRLIEKLNGKNLNTKYVWGGYKLILLWPIIELGKKVFLKDKDMFQDFTDYNEAVKKSGSNPTISFLYQNLTLIEYYFQMLIKIKLHLVMGKTVVSDRYLYDTLVSLAITLNYGDEKFMKMLEDISKYFPKPDLVFYINVPAEVAFERKDDIPSIDYLKYRLRYYELINDLITSRTNDPWYKSSEVEFAKGDDLVFRRIRSNGKEDPRTNVKS
ncbi:MAG: hypothetical protein Q7J35_12340, partial [Candidatus Methanoperedens sp.]|nr:hypothetical protein [Candidatus Methanoperedens sp.]